MYFDLMYSSLIDEATNAQELLASADVKITRLQEEKQVLIDVENCLRIENRSLLERNAVLRGNFKSLIKLRA